jgi:3-(3-hydroxy-phenyl)propionate hydroxylase
MTEHAVVIAGGGPTGLMLAGELALAGIDVAIVERRAGQGFPDALTTWFGPPTVA